MKCKLCEDRLLEYLYGELGEEDAAAMEQHLEASEACRREYEGFASVLDTVAKADEEGPSPALHTRIMGHAEEARPGRRSFWAWMFRPAVTTAVIGAIAAGVYFTTLRHKPPSILDERTLSEESFVRKPLSGNRNNEARLRPPCAKVDSPKKEAKDKGLSRQACRATRRHRARRGGSGTIRRPVEEVGPSDARTPPRSEEPVHGRRLDGRRTRPGAGAQETGDLTGRGGPRSCREEWKEHPARPMRPGPCPWPFGLPGPGPCR